MALKIRSNNQGKKVAVIGAGLFGVLSALRLAEYGFNVNIFEKNDTIMQGASLINQNRVHMGYHYPRSVETASEALLNGEKFKQMFPETVLDDFDHYYCIAKEGSKVTGEEYIEFCDKLGLPHINEFPKNIHINKKAVELSVKVPESLYDGDVLKDSLEKLLSKKKENLKLSLSSTITDIAKRDDSGFNISFSKNGDTKLHTFDVIVNTTYSNINNIIKLVGLTTKKYQYELCEVPIISVPWQKKTGFAIMDGPFFGILPKGFSKDYLLYDVELSVLERTFGEFPAFKHEPSYYNEPLRLKNRFAKFEEKIGRYVEYEGKFSYIRSKYMTRIVLPNRDYDDARPSEILDHGDGLWSVFSGKISSAIPISESIKDKVIGHLLGDR